MNWQLFEASGNVHFKRMLVIFLVSWVLVQFLMLWYFEFRFHGFGNGITIAIIPALVPCVIYLALVWVWNNFFASKYSKNV